MFCRLYMHKPLSREEVLTILEKHFGKAQKRGISDFVFPNFDIMISRNYSYHADKLRMYPDGFLYYELAAEAEVYKDIIPTMNEISKVLWSENIPTVISSDNENELNGYISKLK